MNWIQRAVQVRKSFLTSFQQERVGRVFYGPGEGQGPYSHFSIEQFGDYFWIDHYGSAPHPQALEELKNYFQEVKAKGAILMERQKEGHTNNVAQLFFGQVPPVHQIDHQGLQYQIRFENVKHPGLFLDHDPLRDWLKFSCKGLRVLNTFCYSGSLSLAAGFSGALSVTSLDLSKVATQWAQENWELNNSKFIGEHEPIYGDYFDWAMRWQKKGRDFDMIILDPPSFSRSQKGTFSTKKDLIPLHTAAMALLKKDGILVTSINSENISREFFHSEVSKASQQLQQKYLVLQEISLPMSFPTPLEGELEKTSPRYLKGLILLRQK